MSDDLAALRDKAVSAWQAALSYTTIAVHDINDLNRVVREGEAALAAAVDAQAQYTIAKDRSTR